jgi:hypothetical protein
MCRPFDFHFAFAAQRREKVMSNFALEGTLVTGNKNVTEDLTKYLYQLPTINVSGTSASKTASLNLSNIGCVNFTGGVGSATLQSATLVKNATYIFINTAGAAAGVVTLTLDNHGTIGGQSVFSLISGQPVKFQFDGTNLN